MRQTRIQKVCLRSGFTLIEAVAAMVILAAAACGIFVSFAAAGSAQFQGQRETLAARLAADKIEMLVADGYSSVAAGTETAGTLTDAAGQVLTDAVYQGLSRVTSYQDVAVSGINLRLVTVEIQYNGATIFRLQTLIGDKYAQ